MEKKESISSPVKEKVVDRFKNRVRTTSKRKESKEFPEQISLFQEEKKPTGNTETVEIIQKHPVPVMFNVSEDQINEILRTGSGWRESRKRIYARYQQGRTPEERTEFLKKEYKKIGKGFFFDQMPICTWFDEAGLRIGYGTSIKETPIAEVTWEEIEKRICSMIENGTYMSTSEVSLVDEYERSRIASQILSFFYEGIGEVPSDFQEGKRSSHAYIKDMLSKETGISLIENYIDKVKNDSQKDLDSMQEKIREELSALRMEKRKFLTQDTAKIKQEDFLTQEEFDERIGAGDDVWKGKFRIYEFFSGNHSSREKIDFLKQEFHAEDVTYALMGAAHSSWNYAKESNLLEKSDTKNPSYLKIPLTWDMVEKRVSKLVKSDRYLTSNSKKAYTQYQQERQEYDRQIQCKEAIEKLI